MSTTKSAYKVIGTTDAVTQCECCGKNHLESTVILQHTQTGTEVYYGSSCAAKALHVGTKKLKEIAAVVQRDAEARKALAQHPLVIQYNAERKGIADPTKEMLTRWNDMDKQARKAVRMQFPECGWL